MQDIYKELPPKKQLIITALNGLIAEGNSPESVTVSEIAARAGIGKGTVYEYFSCKEDIFREAVISVSVFHLKNIERLAEDDCASYKEIQLKIIDYILKSSRDNELFFEFMLKAFGSGSDSRICDISRNIIEKYKGDIIKLVKKVIDKALEYGAIQSQPDRSKVEFASFAVLTYLVYSRPGEAGLFGSVYSEEKIKNLCCDMFTKMIS